MSDDFDNGFYEEKRPRDHVVDAAKQVLLDRHFPRDGTQVYYGRQLEVWLERTFFHWITKKALNELVAEHRINFTPETTEHYTAHFYWPLRHRYPRRQIAEILGLIAEFSRPDFSRALGHERELLTDAAFARGGFQILQDRVREVDGKKWTMSNYDLDRLIVRNGIRYGVEIKNQLGYIEQAEFGIKLSMCRHFGVRPMFVARMMPKNYMNTVQLAGGFGLL